MVGKIVIKATQPSWGLKLWLSLAMTQFEILHVRLRIGKKAALR